MNATRDRGIGLDMDDELEYTFEEWVADAAKLAARTPLCWEIGLLSATLVFFAMVSVPRIHVMPSIMTNPKLGAWATIDNIKYVAPQKESDEMMF